MTKFMTLAAMVMLLSVMVVDSSFAATGAEIVQAITNFLSGTPGKLIALILGLAGLWTWLVSQNTGLGISLIVAGLVMVFAPGILNSIFGAVDSAVGNTLKGTEWFTSGKVQYLSMIMGQAELAALMAFLSGPAGKAIAMLAGVYGLWKIFVQQDTKAGIIAIVGSFLLVMLPGVYGSVMGLLNPTVTTLTGSGIPFAK